MSQNHGTKSQGMVNACLNGECCGLELNHSASCAVNDEIHLTSTYNCFSNLPWMSNLLKKKQVSQQGKQSCSLPRTRNRQEKPWTLPEPKQSQPLMASCWFKVCRKVWKIRWQNSLKHHLLSIFAGNLRLLKSFEMTLQALYNGPLKPPTTNFRIIPTW